MLTILIVLATIFFSLRFKRRKASTVAFFHPYCNAGGGGERVLWCAIRAMQARWPSLSYVVFSGDIDATKEQILLRAKQRFGIELDPANIDFIFLRCRRLVEASLYPRFTMLLQTIAGGILAFEAFLRLAPSVFIDSMGYPLSLPIFRWLAGSRVLAYVHYPTISCDMVDVVARRESTFNNADSIAKNAFLSQAKLFYYKAFAMAYSAAGKAAHSVMVNGSWTQSHISHLWGSCQVVFPPCDIDAFLALPNHAEQRLSSEGVVSLLSIGQIRPEKNHALQIRILRAVIDRLHENGVEYKVKLTIAGGCRHAEDEARVEQLRELAKELAVEQHIHWLLNVPYEDLMQELSESMISLHTMRDEHFGISVVEGMAAGTITVAHNSAGPKMDIITATEKGEATGFLADSENGYAKVIEKIIGMKPAEREKIRERARASSKRFSETNFEKSWLLTVEPFVS